MNISPLIASAGLGGGAINNDRSPPSPPYPPASARTYYSRARSGARHYPNRRVERYIMPPLGSRLRYRRSKLSAAGWPPDVKKFNVCEREMGSRWVVGGEGEGGRGQRRRARRSERVRRELERRSSRARRAAPRRVYCERARTVGKKTGRRRSIFLITPWVQPRTPAPREG